MTGDGLGLMQHSSIQHSEIEINWGGLFQEIKKAIGVLLPIGGMTGSVYSLQEQGK